MYKRCKCSKQNNCCNYDDSKMFEVEKQLKLISVKTRLNLLFLLKKKNHCVSDLVRHTNMSQSLISHHLADLEYAGLLRSKKEGRFTEYSLSKKGKVFSEAIFNMIKQGR